MKKFLLILLFSSSVWADTAVLSWTNPIQNCDGSVLTAAQLQSIKVYIGTKGRVAAGLPATTTNGCSGPTMIIATDPKVAIAYEIGVVLVPVTSGSSYTYPSLVSGTKYYFAVSAFGSGGESSLSNEVSKIALIPPSPILLDPSCLGCSIYNGKILLGETGKPITIGWQTLTGSKTVKVFKYPLITAAIPVAQGTVTADTFTYVPTKAGMYSVQVCLGTSCTDSSATSYLFYITLAPVTGGGVKP